MPIHFKIRRVFILQCKLTLKELIALFARHSSTLRNLCGVVDDICDVVVDVSGYFRVVGSFQRYPESCFGPDLTPNSGNGISEGQGRFAVPLGGSHYECL